MRLVKLAMITGEQEGEDDQVTPTTAPVYVNPETVRSVRPRKDNAPGTRIEFPNSAALIVQEDVDQVYAALTGGT